MKLGYYLISILITGLGQKVFAADSVIIDIRKQINLSDSDPVLRDVYIQLGEQLTSAKKDQIINVYRLVSIRDAKGAQSYGDIKIPVGKLKVIAVYDKVVVAREIEVFSREALPILDQPGFMTGDLVAAK